jgi:hypothetical protein
MRLDRLTIADSPDRCVGVVARDLDEPFGASPGCRYLRAACLALLVLLGATGVAGAGEQSKELWPEIDFWLRLSPAWRLSSFVALSKNIETDYREGSFLFQADYAWGKPGRLYQGRLLDEGRAETMKAMLARGGYLVGKSLDDKGETYQEKTIFLEWHMRVPLKARLLLTHRLRADFRWLGDDYELSNRWRYRVMVEKEVDAGGCSWVPYGSAEAFYDTRYDTFNRFRFIAGTSVGWSPRYALEGNITYQHDSKSSVTDIYALNLILHLYFEKRRAPQE